MDLIPRRFVFDLFEAERLRIDKFIDLILRHGAGCFVGKATCFTPGQYVAYRCFGTSDALRNIAVSEKIHLFETKDFRDLHKV